MNIPFKFIIDSLTLLNVSIKPMFGMYGVYVNQKIVLILRDRIDHPEMNGAWVATKKEHHNSLKKEFPLLGPIYALHDDAAETDWQMLHAESKDFESSAMKVCRLINQGDPRIGRIPKRRRGETKNNCSPI